MKYVIHYQNEFEQKQSELIERAAELLRDVWQFQTADSALKRDEWLKDYEQK
jgi:hypothetical protein